jgi:CheY-like chemotaxis protein
MTILIVDDHEENRYHLQVLFRSSGFEVATAANGAEALAIARQTPPDLVVSDVLMPVMDGFALCRAWVGDPLLQSVPLVFYSATYTDARDQDFALSLGARHFIVKPEAPEVILGIVRALLHRTDGPSQLPGSKAPTASPSEAPRSPVAEEASFLQQYNSALIRKLEQKMQQVERMNEVLRQDIAERLRAESELALQIEGLRRWQQATLGREGRVLELKREVNELLAEAGLPPRYSSATEDPNP